MILFGYLSAFLFALPPPRCTSMCQETLLVHWINVVLKQHNWEQNRYLLHNSQASRVFVFFALAIAAETFEYNFLEYKFFAEKGFVWVLVMLVTFKLLASLTRREVNLKSFPGIDFLQMRIFKIAFHWDGVREAIQIFPLKSKLCILLYEMVDLQHSCNEKCCLCSLIALNAYSQG